MELQHSELVDMYSNLVRARKLDESCCNAVFMGKIFAYYHSSQGQEALAVGAIKAAYPDDWTVFSNRYTAHCVAKGMDMKSYVAEWYAKSTGCCGGRSGYHPSSLEIGIPGISGTLGGCFPLAAGLGLSVKYKGSNQVVLCFFGDGAGGRGLLHEGMLMASNWKLPIVWICENNGLAVSTPSDLVYPMKDIADLSSGYHMPGVLVDGQDVIAVYEVAKEAIARARNGEGPSLIECKTHRFRPHAEGLPDSRSPEQLGEIRQYDPIHLFENKLLSKGILNETLIAQIAQAAADEVEQAEQFADESPSCDPATIYDGLFV